MINNEEEFHAEKARLQEEAATANKRFEDAQVQKQQLLLNTQLEAAFRDAGGISSGIDADGFQAIKSMVQIELEGDKIVIRDKFGDVEKNSDGTTKSLEQKMQELRRNSTCKNFFSGAAASPEEAPKKDYDYTREDARKGRASMNDIASGKAKVENTSGKPETVPDTKKVDATKIADTKTRKWK